MENTPNINETAEVDVLALLQKAEDEEAEAAVENPVADETPTEPELSPLEKAKLEKAQRGIGLEVDKATFDDGTKPKEFKDVTQSPETEAGVDDSIAEMEAMVKALEANPHITSLPENDVQARVDIVNQLVAAGEKIQNGETATVEMPDSVDNTEVAIQTPTPEVPEESPQGVVPVDTNANMASIIIDKTGLGANFDFSDEEMEKLTKASKIRLVEVESKELKSATFNRVGRDDSFLGRASKYELSSVVTPVTLPASRYRCRMRGMSFGEMSDIGLDPQNVTYDLLNKRFSVIFNNMIDTSVGKFETYEEFLKATSYMDFEMLVFGMLCSTLPEEDSITLTCARNNCGKEYDAKYSPRGLVRWDDCDERLLAAVNDVCDAANSPEKAEELFNTSAVHQVKSFEMPYSKIVIDFGAVSMWDFLHGVANIILDPEFEEKFKDNDKEVATLAAQTLTVVRAISIPTENGTYDLYTNPEDMFEILRKLNPQDFSIILNVMNQYASAYNVPFYIPNSKCPHCGFISKKVTIPIRQLVFTKLQMLGATEIDLTSAVII